MSYLTEKSIIFKISKTVKYIEKTIFSYSVSILTFTISIRKKSDLHIPKPTLSLGKHTGKRRFSKVLSRVKVFERTGENKGFRKRLRHCAFDPCMGK